jgi:hypothetical protein
VTGDDVVPGAVAAGVVPETGAQLEKLCVRETCSVLFERIYPETPTQIYAA